MKNLILSLFLICGLLLFLHYKSNLSKPSGVSMQAHKTPAESTKLSPKERLQPYLEAQGFQGFPKQIMLIALKEERILELWGKDQKNWKMIKKYPFTAFSGQLGPKLKQGDRQIPEGIYAIEYLNPNSSYHLSLRVNYPNSFDKRKAALEKRTNLGGDIYIHGKAVTIGCIPLGDKGIEELFLIADKTLEQGIKVIVSPVDFRVKNTIPEISSVTWEEELYGIIKKELHQYKTN